MADPYPIRPITDDEYAALRVVHEHAFNSGPVRAADWPRTARQFEAERSLAAFDAALRAGAGSVRPTSAAPGSARSPPPALSPKPGQARSGGSPPLWPGTRRRGAQGSTTVSYTHLTLPTIYSV